MKNERTVRLGAIKNPLLEYIVIQSSSLDEHIDDFLPNILIELAFPAPHL
jgi:hypothetical protein